MSFLEIKPITPTMFVPNKQRKDTPDQQQDRKKPVVKKNNTTETRGNKLNILV